MPSRKHPHEEEGEPATSSLEGKVAEMESAAAETRDRYLRLAADFENYKKRTRQEQMETIQHASADLISRLLPVVDDLEKVLEHRPAGIDESWLKGAEPRGRKLQEGPGTHRLRPHQS